ncbi:hypothetical protein PN498_28270 [Oscillatoria sp. CS-180]|uniref:hypothetical protein n=1 Tax=Oscillatoria sp. CS-180 TaxID=3021720 RepID=UPI00232CB0FF|nr:hypothetical protein [Oscillatoria sp. CS-180]MDB9529915.1 hypothetical protein [Oscillatoria sp. CS-180]
MPGTKDSGRPGGNPALKTAEYQEEHGYQIQDPTREEAFTAQLQLRITPSMQAALKAMGKQRNQFIRDAIAEKLERENQQ